MKDSLVLGGTYRHYKGNDYKVLYVAKHSETLEDMVVYQCQYGDMSIWVRPLKMFVEEIVVQGKEVKRFTLLQ